MYLYSPAWPSILVPPVELIFASLMDMYEVTRCFPSAEAIPCTIISPEHTSGLISTKEVCGVIWVLVNATFGANTCGYFFYQDSSIDSITGVLHGDNLAPNLFIILLDCVLGEALDGKI